MSNTIKISESKIQKHLSCYRASNSIFEVDEKHSGWVLKNETDNLLKTSYYENLLEFYKDIEERGLIHTWFRSLKSSQAMAINFFGALAREEETFIKVLQNVGSTIPSYTETIPRFEYIEEDSVLGGNPKKFDKTNFDFVLKSKDCNYYFEFKYTEKEFGKHKKEDILEHDNKENLPSKDDYQYKFNNLYKELLEKIGVKLIPLMIFIKIIRSGATLRILNTVKYFLFFQVIVQTLQMK